MRRWIDHIGLQEAIGLAALAWMPLARAEESDLAPQVLNLGAGPGLIQITFNLLLVLGAIVILAWLFKRVQGIHQPAAGALRVSASLPLGPKERLLVVEVGDEQILIGASSSGLSRLHVLKTPLALPQNPPLPESFKDRLTAALSKPQT
ncbi:MAG: flagellar biosynthetic protein FliO [Gammaproteobacteria bacterium]